MGVEVFTKEDSENKTLEVRAKQSIFLLQEREKRIIEKQGKNP